MKIDTSRLSLFQKWLISVVAWFATLYVVTGIELSDGRKVFWLLLLSISAFVIAGCGSDWEKNGDFKKDNEKRKP